MPIYRDRTGKTCTRRLTFDWRCPQGGILYDNGGLGGEGGAPYTRLDFGAYYNHAASPSDEFLSLSAWNGFYVLGMGPSYYSYHPGAEGYTIRVRFGCPDGYAYDVETVYTGTVPQFAGSLTITMSGVQEWASAAMRDPTEGDESYEYPQYGYTAWNPYTTSGGSVVYSPYRGGAPTGMLYTQLDYYELIPAGSAFEMVYVINGVTYTHSGVYASDTVFAYDPAILAQGTNLGTAAARFGMSNAALSVVGIETLPLDWSGLSVIAENDPTFTHGRLDGAAGGFTVTLDASTPTPDRQNNEMIVHTAALPPMQLALHGRTVQPGGAPWEGSPAYRWTWDGNWDDGGVPHYLKTAAHAFASGIVDGHFRLRQSSASVLHYSAPGIVASGAVREQPGVYGVFYDDNDPAIPTDGGGGWLTGAGVQHPRLWRILGHDPAGVNLLLLTSNPDKISDTFSEALGSTPYTATNGSLSGGGGSLTLTASGGAGSLTRSCLSGGVEVPDWDWKHFRYLGLTGQVSANQTLTVTVSYRVYHDDGLGGTGYTTVTKTYDAALTTVSGEVVIDLCSPKTYSGSSPGYDTTDWSEDATSETARFMPGQITAPPLVMEANDTLPDNAPARLYGIGKVSAITVSGLTNGHTLTLSKVRVLRQSRHTLTVCPVDQLSQSSDPARSWGDYDGALNPLSRYYHPEGGRQAWSLTDCKQTGDHPYKVFASGAWLNTAFPTVTQFKADLEDGGGVSAEFYAILGGTGNSWRIPADYFAGWLAGATWSPGWTPQGVWDRSLLTEFTLEGRVAFDLVSFYPSCGIPAGGVPFPSGQYGGEFPVLFYSVLGLAVHGLTHDPASHAVTPNVNVSLLDHRASDALLASGTSDNQGYYRLVYPKTADAHNEIKVATDTTSVIIQTEARRYKHVSLEGTSLQSADTRSPVEVSGRRRRVYLAQNAMQVVSYYSPTLPLATLSPAYSVDYWHRYHTSDRAQTLFLIAKSGSDFIVYRSLDDGLTLLTGVTMANSKAALIAENGLAREMLLVYQDNSDAVYAIHSYDFGTTWESLPGTRCQLSGNLTATIYDLDYEPRRKAYLMTINQSSTLKLLESPDGISWSQITL